MSQFVVLTPDQFILGGATHKTRIGAMQFAQVHTARPWTELADEGYRIKMLVSRVPAARRVVTLASIDLPEEQLQRLEMLATRSGHTVRHVASLMIASGLANSKFMWGSRDA